MAKRDRWERIVARYANKGMTDYDECVLADREVIKLLRKQHRAFVRMVNKSLKEIRELAREAAPETKLYFGGREDEAAKILSKLNERAK